MSVIKYFTIGDIKMRPGAQRDAVSFIIHITRWMSALIQAGRNTNTMAVEPQEHGDGLGSDRRGAFILP